MNQQIKGLVLLGASFSLTLWGQAEDSIAVPGKVTGYGSLKRDGMVDGSMVIPTLRSGDLLSFQIDQLMGPGEELKVGPVTADLPSNFHLPRQKERLAFIPITIKKESFTAYLRPDTPEELSAISFKAPFDELMSLAQEEDVPFTRMLPLIEVQKMGYLGERDWSEVSSVTLPLNQSLDRSLSFEWNRDRAPVTESDHLFAFQETDMSRWTLSDLQGDVGTSGTLKMTSHLRDSSKLLFIRMEENSDMTYAQGHFRSGQIGGQIQVEGVPPRLEARLDPSGLIEWDSFSDAGWMMALVERKESQQLLQRMQILGFFEESLRAMSQTIQRWAAPQSGELELGVGTFDQDSVSLVFIGTDRHVQIPEPGEDSPELFDAAQEIRIRKLQ